MSKEFEQVLVNVHDLIEVLSTASDALDGERVSKVFEQTGQPSTWFDHFTISANNLQLVIDKWRKP